MPGRTRRVQPSTGPVGRAAIRSRRPAAHGALDGPGEQQREAAGKVTFTSVFPACCSGRWAHVHVEVYPDRASLADSTSAIATSQVALPQEVCDTV